MPVRTEVAMGTLVTIQVHRSGPDTDAALDRAFGWFYEIEERCSRFDARSELRQLTDQPGDAVPVSAILFEAVRFALMVAEVTSGAFDPGVGRRMETRGFNREYRTGAIAASGSDGEAGSYRDVRLDPDRRTITLLRPIILDLGAVVKGLAIDTAARELQPFRDFAIDAGGDLYLGGSNPDGGPWRIGIRHPRQDSGIIASVYACDQAVCTSGDYERRVSSDCEHNGEHHIIDPRTGASPRGVASVTVVAPEAILADALATAVFVLGAKEGIELLDRLGVEGLIVTPELEQHQTRGLHLEA